MPVSSNSPFPASASAVVFVAPSLIVPANVVVPVCSTVNVGVPPDKVPTVPYPLRALTAVLCALRSNSPLSVTFPLPLPYGTASAAFICRVAPLLIVVSPR